MAVDSQATRGGAQKPPIIQNPAFPAVVALWFAALLGLGSLVLPVILLETAVDATGLAAVFPAASPPLGMKARTLIGLIAALLGAGLGWVIARRLAKMHAPAGKPRFVPTASSSEKRRPISAHDELGDEGLGESISATPRRRSLAISEDERPSDYLWLAPLPGQDSYGDAAPIAQERTAVPASAEVDAADLEHEEPLELCDIAADPIIIEIAPELDPNMDEDDHFPWEQDTAGDELPAQFPSPDEKVRRLEDRRSGKPGRGPGGMERRLFVREPDAEPLPFAAPSLARRMPDNETKSAEPSELAEVDFMEDAQQEFGTPVAVSSYEPAAANGDVSAAPLDGLGLVQLVERLGSSLEKRRELAARKAATAAQPILASVPDVTPATDLPEDTRLPMATPELFDAAPADEAAKAMAAYFGRPASPTPSTLDDFAASAAIPAPLSDRMAALAATSLEPDEDDEDAHDLTASFALPLRRTVLTAPEEGTVDTAETSEDTFGSLLDLHNPFEAKREEFVRVEEPEQADAPIQPTVVFPGREPSLRAAPAAAPVASEPSPAGRMFDPPAAGTPVPGPKSAPADADEALRKALATLQRMSSSG